MSTLHRSILIMTLLTSYVTCHHCYAANPAKTKSKHAIVVDCVLNNPDKKIPLQTLFDRDGQQQIIYTHPCNDGLYLMDKQFNPQEQWRDIVPVIQGWKLEQYQLSQWSDIQNKTLHIRASFTIPVGPWGKQTLETDLQIVRNAGHWQMLKPVIFQGQTDIPKLTAMGGPDNASYIYQVESKAQLESSSFSSRLKKSAPDIDFSRERLLIVPLLQTHGSIKKVETFVTLDETGYQLKYKFIRGFMIGTTYVHKIYVWYVLPKDGLAVVSFKEAPDQNTHHLPKIASGVL